MEEEREDRTLMDDDNVGAFGWCFFYFVFVSFNAKQKLSVIHLSTWETCILPGVLHMKDGCMKISVKRRDLLFWTILLCSLVQWEEENCRIISKSHGSRLPPGGYREERPLLERVDTVK